MKNLTFIILAILIASCGNKKVEIVERQKKVRDSMITLKNQYSVNMLARSIKMKDSFIVQHPNWVRLGLIDQAVKMDTQGYKLSVEMQTLSNNIHELRDQFDSLELELKKY
jgi:hypothetical protein